MTKKATEYIAKVVSIINKTYEKSLTVVRGDLGAKVVDKSAFRTVKMKYFELH